MLEDIILLETAKALGNHYKEFKLQFASGEFDMVIYDRRENCCAAFKIKHSRQTVPEQARHLRDAEKCTLTQRRFGVLVGKYVLYQGKNIDAEDGILYRNAEEFLKMLPEMGLLERLSDQQNMNLSGNDAQEFRMTMQRNLLPRI